MDGMNRRPNDPNKGMNTRVYLVWVVASLVVICFGLLLWVFANRTKAVPKAAAPNPMKSQLERAEQTPGLPEAA